MPLLEEMPGLDQAISALEAAEAAENIAPVEVTPEAEPAPQQPVETPSEASPKPDSLPTGTPAEVEPKPSTEPKTETQKAAEKNKSSFVKNAERLDKSWNAVNAEKVRLEALDVAIKQRESSFKRQEENFKLQQSRTQQRFTPQQYEEASQNKLKLADNLALMADGLDRKADELENAGKLLESQQAKQQAQEKRDEAAAERGLARQMKTMAGQAQSTPDASVVQIQARRQQEKQHYTLEAAKAWPDVAKAGSEFQKKMAEHLNAAAQQGISPDEYPIMMYHAARLTAAETTAARVPVMEKELGELRAKVKDYEKLTSPGGGSTSAQAIPQKGAQTAEEEFESLRMEAAGR